MKKPVRARNVTANELAGMKALRSYTSALKLGYVKRVELMR